MTSLYKHRIMKSQELKVCATEVAHYLALLTALYSDVASAYPASVRVECLRDLTTIRLRTYEEGISFLTKTLPSLAKEIDKSLASGTPLTVTAFRKLRGTKLPRFMGWLLKDVFHSDGTEICEAPDVTSAYQAAASTLALKSLRQLLYCFYKLELPYDQASQAHALDAFKQTESEMATFPTISGPTADIIRCARTLVAQIVQEHDPRDIVPKHGPGAVATGEEPWEKAAFKRFYPELHESYPYESHMYFSPSHFLEERVMCGQSNLEWMERPPLSKLVFVPKDSRGPRSISMEPLELQWIQQGLKAVLESAITQHRLTKGQINFTDQTINQRLAREASITGANVTLDMKDASDRVSLALVQMLFPSDWVECLESCRSHGTVCPDGETVMFNKFAPMGSALCFPVESLVFWALSVSTLICGKQRNPWRAAKEVFVYGDDLIVSAEDYTDIINALEAVGLRFNPSKCCTGFSFRESCGVDAYHGVVVTPLRIKRRWRSRSMPVQTIAAYVEASNNFYAHGYIRTAEFLEKELQQRFRVPYTAADPSGVMFVRPDASIVRKNREAGIKLRFCPRKHLPSVKALTLVPMQVESTETGYRELLSWWCRSKRHARTQDDPIDSDDLDVEVFPRLDSNLISPSAALKRLQEGFGSIPQKAGLYSVPHRVTSKWGWTHVTL